MPSILWPWVRGAARIRVPLRGGERLVLWRRLHGTGQGRICGVGEGCSGGSCGGRKPNIELVREMH